MITELADQKGTFKIPLRSQLALQRFVKVLELKAPGISEVGVVESG